MSESDFERGYAKGFADGYERGLGKVKEEARQPSGHDAAMQRRQDEYVKLLREGAKKFDENNKTVYINPRYIDPITWEYKCPVCGINGVQGSVCNHPKCPTKNY